jgi:predicted DNA-binding protein
MRRFDKVFSFRLSKEETATLANLMKYYCASGSSLSERFRDFIRKLDEDL